ncbi:hypothetical protein [Cupriavidus sp. TMH.W2]|uniref:hypothetical protein n=1 Tax=Cupriavidus sp. TMH.W2 TaxID=3434465 RepID=UPI003D771DB5
MKFTNHNLSEKGLAPFTAVMAGVGTGVVAAQTAALKGIMNSRPLTMAVLLPAAAFAGFVLCYSPVGLGRVLLTGDLAPIRGNPAHAHILACAIAIFALVTTALYIKAYKFGPGVFSYASSWIVRLGIIGGFVLAAVAGLLGYEKLAAYIAAVLVASYPLMVAENLAVMIAKHPVAAGQPIAEIEKYLWQGVPGSVAKLCVWAGIAVVALRFLIWFTYLHH